MSFVYQSRARQEAVGTAGRTTPLPHETVEILPIVFFLQIDGRVASY